MYINSWSDIPDGATVIQDTWPERYLIFTRDGKRFLRLIGPENIPHIDAKIGEEREIDFEPNCIYDQPWIRLD
jgi:hypothetical protein